MLHRMPILGYATRLDAAVTLGDAHDYFDNDTAISNGKVLVFPDNGLRSGVNVRFAVPKTYSSAAKIVVEATAGQTSGVWVLDFDYRVIQGNNAASLDVASVQESVSGTGGPCAAAYNRIETTLAALTAGNFSPDNTVEGKIFRDGTDASDTLAGDLLVTGLWFEFDDGGFSGATGVQGATGLGAFGTTGLPGPTGFAGATGPQGSTGVGPQGATGLPGPTGFQGATGATGETGPGATGPSGPTGVAGGAGAQGETGLGVTGPQGIAGEAGSQGADGQTGPQGATGVAGAAGDAGAQGVTGPGATGLQGPTGPQGAEGSAGAQGATGPGATGPQGATGLQGAQGDQGATGAGGGGDTGLPGPTGPQGATGVQGAQGDAGPQGATGVQGSQGSQGETGTQGAQGSQGETGPGATGLPGPTGTQGIQGATGAGGGVGQHWIGDTGAHIGATSTANNLVAFDTNGLPTRDSGIGTTPDGGTGAPPLNFDYTVWTPTGGLAGDFWPQRGLTGGIGATGPMNLRYLDDEGVIHTWYSGVTGGSGQTGPQGATGAAGSAGAAGATGVQGAQGDAGAQGATGPGATGPQGQTGVQGTQGNQGATGAGGGGETGVQGVTGVAGTQGATGPAFMTGNWNIHAQGGANALTGTLAEFLVPYSIILNQWTLTAPMGETGPFRVNVLKSSYANYPPATAMHVGDTGPYLLAADNQKRQVAISGWSGPTAGPGDVIRVTVDDNTGGIKSITLAADWARYG